MLLPQRLLSTLCSQTANLKTQHDLSALSSAQLSADSGQEFARVEVFTAALCIHGMILSRCGLTVLVAVRQQRATEAASGWLALLFRSQHKIQRGYLPSLTHSVHYIRDEGFRDAVAHFLRREAGNIDYTMEALTTQASPYKTLIES